MYEGEVYIRIPLEGFYYWCHFYDFGSCSRNAEDAYHVYPLPVIFSLLLRGGFFRSILGLCFSSFLYVCWQAGCFFSGLDWFAQLFALLDFGAVLGAF
jgi:hypothetical protein